MEGEKNTAFFWGLEKTRQTKKVINELYDKNGTTDQNEIMKIEVDYYKKLYKSTNPDNDKLKLEAQVSLYRSPDINKSS